MRLEFPFPADNFRLLDKLILQNIKGFNVCIEPSYDWIFKGNWDFRPLPAITLD